MPGFAVGAEEAVSAGVAFGIEEQAGAVSDKGDGEDEPGVLGDDVGDEEVDFGGAVGDGAASGAAITVDVIEAVEKSGGRFDLDAEEAASGVEDEVVTFAVAVGLGDAEAHSGGFVGESEFGEFAAALGGEFAEAGRFLPTLSQRTRQGWGTRMTIGSQFPVVSSQGPTSRKNGETWGTQRRFLPTLSQRTRQGWGTRRPNDF